MIGLAALNGRCRREATAWAPWLDPVHPRPAKPGELRWFTAGSDGEDIEVDGRGPHLISGEQVLARSRDLCAGAIVR